MTPITHKSVVTMAVPIMLANVSQPLLGVVDTAVIGQLPEPHYIGAIAIGALIFSLVYWGFGFLRMGTSGIAAQAYGVTPDIICSGKSLGAGHIPLGAMIAREDMGEAFLGEDRLPVCDDCGGMVKTATISFGQAMPEAAMRIAEEATLDCDLFLAIGSSLVVYPAAGFPILAKRNGARLVILNREPTDLDQMADLVLNAEIGDTKRTATGANCR